MLTSSISGEGKTFCSINIATVFALSEKRTIILGLDLRKPKIFDDFNVKNDIGAVNYLIGQKKLDEVVQKEKQRIGQELHDGVLGRLFGARLNLDSLNKKDDEQAVAGRNHYISELKNIEHKLREVSMRQK